MSLPLDMQRSSKLAKFLLRVLSPAGPRLSTIALAEALMAISTRAGMSPAEVHALLDRSPGVVLH